MSLLTSLYCLVNCCIPECSLTEQDFSNGRDIDVSIQLSDGHDPVNNAVENGAGNYQGDIQLSTEQYEVIENNKPKNRNLNLIKHWTQENGLVTIPYTINACEFDEEERANLARAIEEYKNKTCIRFIYTCSLHISSNVSIMPSLYCHWHLIIIIDIIIIIFS